MAKGENERIPLKEGQDQFRDKDQVTQAQTKGKRVEKADDDGQKNKGDAAERVERGG